MGVNNAAQASEIVKAFCEKMNPDLTFVPQGATQENSQWMVKVIWGFTPLVFEVNPYTGEIIKYYREKP